MKTLSWERTTSDSSVAFMIDGASTLIYRVEHPSRVGLGWRAFLTARDKYLEVDLWAKKSDDPREAKKLCEQHFAENFGAAMWQSPETAPRDGTRVHLLCKFKDGEHEIHPAAYWSDNKSCPWEILWHGQKASVAISGKVVVGRLPLPAMPMDK